MIVFEEGQFEIEAGYLKFIDSVGKANGFPTG